MTAKNKTLTADEIKTMREMAGNAKKDFEVAPKGPIRWQKRDANLLADAVLNSLAALDEAKKENDYLKRNNDELRAQVEKLIGEVRL